LYAAVEQGLFVVAVFVFRKIGGCAAFSMLKRIEVVELLRGLHESDTGVIEVAKRVGEEARSGDVVCIQDGHEFGVDVVESVVDVAGFAVDVLGAGEVTSPKLVCKLFYLLTVAVIKHPCFVRRLESNGRGDGREENLARFVVCGDEDGDTGCCGLDVARRSLGVDVPEREREQTKAEHGVDLESEKGNGHPPGSNVQCVEGPPRQVGQAYGQGQ
jgi:hypothetical protein